MSQESYVLLLETKSYKFLRKGVLHYLSIVNKNYAFDFISRLI